jgi:hypothetical protein
MRCQGCRRIRDKRRQEENDKEAKEEGKIHHVK